MSEKFNAMKISGKTEWGKKVVIIAIGIKIYVVHTLESSCSYTQLKYILCIFMDPQLTEDHSLIENHSEPASAKCFKILQYKL